MTDPVRFTSRGQFLVPEYQIPSGGKVGQHLVKTSDEHSWAWYDGSIPISATAPSNPRVGDLWIDISFP